VSHEPPPPDPSALPKPPHEPPHDRFFEDGEEPQERYDLDDELEYVLPRHYELDTRKYFRIGRRCFQTCRREALGRGAAYFFAWFLGSICVGWVYYLFLDPQFRAMLVFYSLGQLTGLPKRYKGMKSDFRQYGPVLVCDLPTGICGVVAFYAAYMVLWFAIIDKDLSLLWLAPAVLTPLMLLYLFLVIRLTCFAPALIRDYDLGPLQAMRACWKLSRGHFWGLLWLKIRLWAMLYGLAIPTLGIAMIWAMPFTTMIWTAAYLDIVGANPIREEYESPGPATSVTMIDARPEK